MMQMNGGIVMDEKWTDSELLLKIEVENKKLWSALKDLAELHKENPAKAKNVIDQLVLLLKKQV